MKYIGIVLIILGIVGFLVGGISFTDTETVVDAGPIQVEAQEERNVPITPWASGAALLAGIVLVVVDRRRT